jgi:hypothetical protein
MCEDAVSVSGMDILSGRMHVLTSHPSDIPRLSSARVELYLTKFIFRNLSIDICRTHVRFCAPVEIALTSCETLTSNLLFWSEAVSVSIVNSSHRTSE